MERICPFLATSDGRAVVDGYDPANGCRAGEVAFTPDRAQQSAACLQDAHRACDRFATAMRERGLDAPNPWPVPAADAAFVQTRLVLNATPARRLSAAAAMSPATRRWAVGGALATVGVAAVATGVAGSLGGLIGRPSSTDAAAATPSSSATATVRPTTATPVPIGSTASEPPATAEPTPVPSPTSQASASAAATPAPTPSPTAAPAVPRTYVVQRGDTLNGIAIRFGTTVEALQRANGLGANDVILVGQVLVIPS